MFSSSFKGTEFQDFVWNSNYGKQLIWLLLTSFLGVVILLIDGNLIKNSSYLIYGVITNFKNYICNRSFSSSLCNIKKFRYYQNNPCLF